MFEDFDTLNNQKQEDDEDSESYSYPSYSRFTYTGKTKSRLGRSRFMRQTGTKDETKKSDDVSSGTSDLKSGTHFLQSNTQPPKTPGLSWLQRESSVSTHPFTPGGNSKSVHGSYSDLSSLPSQSNFLFNLKSDSAQNLSCKRNLPFSTTPFKNKPVPVESKANDNPLKELNQLIKPENPFSKLDFFNRTKEENKENSSKGATDGKSNDLNPSWNQLKKICDASIPYPNLPTSLPETISGSAGDPADLRKSKAITKSTSFAPFSIFENKNEKKDDDSSNMPLDLSSAESTVSRTLFSRSLMSGSDNIDGDSSGSLNRPLKDSTNESIVKRFDDSTAQKTNTDTLSSFLPKFLVPRNTNNKTELPEEDVSAHSIGTVVERTFDIQPQPPTQKSQHFSQTPSTTPITKSENRGVEVLGNETHSSSQYKSTHSDVKKTSPQIPPLSLTKNDPSQFSIPKANNEIQFQPQLHHNINQKYSPPSVQKSIVPVEPSKVSPPSNNVPDFRNLVNNGQHLLNEEQNLYAQQPVNTNMQLMRNENEINSLAQNIEAKLGFVSKSSANEQVVNHNTISDKHVSPLKIANELYPSNQSKSDIKPEDLIKPMVSNQQMPSSGNQMERNSEPLNNLYSGARHELRPPAQPNAVERSLNHLSVQQPRPTTVGPKDPAVYTRPQESIQQPLLSQKTYLAPQQPPNPNNASNFPHVKPEIPQLGGKPSFQAMKKPTQYKMTGPRGMPSRTDTELSVNGKSYGILSMLGKGGSSEVYQVLDPCTSKLLAVKCVDLSMVDKTIADGYLNEIDLLSRLQGCASVIRMFDYEYVQDFKMLYVVMEKGDTDLSHLIRDISKTKKISMSMIIYYWTEMLQAVKDIHDQGIIHSDLKPANFLLVSGRLKLIDFGIASSQGDMTSVVKEVTTGTWNYMSPEAIKNTSASGKGFKITYKSDVWSLGCILYNLVYGKTPFSHITNTWGKLTAIADPNHCIQFPDVGAPAVLVRALQSCFHREPKLRPTVAELLSLPYHSTGDGSELSGVGRQVQAILPPLEWLKVAHLFPGVKSNQEGKPVDNSAESK